MSNSKFSHEEWGATLNNCMLLLLKLQHDQWESMLAECGSKDVADRAVDAHKLGPCTGQHLQLQQPQEALTAAECWVLQRQRFKRDELAFCHAKLGHFYIYLGLPLSSCFPNFQSIYILFALFCPFLLFLGSNMVPLSVDPWLHLLEEGSLSFKQSNSLWSVLLTWEPFYLQLCL